MPDIFLVITLILWVSIGVSAGLYVWTENLDFEIKDILMIPFFGAIGLLVVIFLIPIFLTKKSKVLIEGRHK